MIADRIKNLREQRGYTQTSLSKRLGLTRTAINAWETGISTPSTQYIVEMASLFKVSSDYLLCIDTTETIDVSQLTMQQRNILCSLIEQFENCNALTVLINMLQQGSDVKSSF